MGTLGEGRSYPDISYIRTTVAEGLAEKSHRIARSLWVLGDGCLRVYVKETVAIGSAGETSLTLFTISYVLRAFV